MNLSKKKNIAKKIFKVGDKRIVFLESRIGEIKEAITKQDIRDLHQSGAIIIKIPKGRKKVIRKEKRSTGNIRKKVKKRKKEYVIMTKKLRNYLKNLKASGRISQEEMNNLRKRIRNKEFRSKVHLRENIGGIKDENIEKKKKRK
jgi:large subunit ribosomal protein L19e